jgi:hypothetical protein
MFIILDTGPLGDLVNPYDNPKTRAIRAWMRAHLDKGVRFVIPEIADYEVRRSDILNVLNSPFGPCDSAAALYLLDQLKTAITYEPLTTPTILLAARLWAEKRKGTAKGDPEHHPKLDADIIITAQAIQKSGDHDPVVIATMNLKDFLFSPTPTVTAEEWQKI